jgi:hypothetical protein
VKLHMWRGSIGRSREVVSLEISDLLLDIRAPWTYSLRNWRQVVVKQNQDALESMLSAAQLHENGTPFHLGAMRESSTVSRG